VRSYYHLEDPKKILNVLRALKKYKYDDKRIVAEFSVRRSMKKERIGIEFDRRRLEERIRKVKDVLPLAEQIMQLKIGIGEILAFHSAAFEKADVEKIPLETAAYRIAEDIRDYRQLGGFKQEHDKAVRQICILNAIAANKQAALMSCFRHRIPHLHHIVCQLLIWAHKFNQNQSSLHYQCQKLWSLPKLFRLA
ncbi:MAG: hypothetical protein WAM14_20975, partial [Candidatus Nitrosopolaris sp.]